MAQLEELGLPPAIPQAFRYPLLRNFPKQIRLLHISPGDDDTMIECHLEVVDFDDALVYNTLSYVWGDTNTNLQEIHVDGAPFEVTQNQYLALRHLRMKGVDTIWIDGICINQTDLHERTAHVAAMRWVYQKAARVYVWLGTFEDAQECFSDSSFLQTEDEPGEFARRVQKHFDLLGLAKPDAEHPESYYRADQDRTLTNNEVVSEAGIIDEFLHMHSLMVMKSPLHMLPFYRCTDDGIKSRQPWFEAVGLLYWIVRCPWWQRVWVVQEVHKTVKDPLMLIGTFEIGLSKILDVVDHFRDLQTENYLLSMVVFQGFSGTDDGDYVLKLAQLRYLETIEIRQKPWAAWLLSSARNATDLRDHVYGILGLLDDSQANAIQPDYHIHNVSLIYNAASRLVIESMGNLECLSTAIGVWENGSVEEELGTWALDWTKQSNFYPPVYSFLFNANKDNNFETQPCPHSSQIHLTCSGFQVGTITDLSTAAKNEPHGSERGDDFDRVEILSTLLDWIRFAGIQGQELDAIQALTEPDRYTSDVQFWKTFLCGDGNFTGQYDHIIGHEPGNRKASSSDVKEISLLWKALQAKETGRLEEIPDRWPEDEEKSFFWKTICGTILYDVLRGRKLFSFRPTRPELFDRDHLLIGNARPSTKLGDAIFVLAGCAAPVILRPTGDRAESYRFVGLSYVDGIMDGEAVLDDTEWKRLCIT